MHPDSTQQSHYQFVCFSISLFEYLECISCDVLISIWLLPFIQKEAKLEELCKQLIHQQAVDCKYSEGLMTTPYYRGESTRSSPGLVMCSKKNRKIPPASSVKDIYRALFHAYQKKDNSIITNKRIIIRKQVISDLIYKSFSPKKKWSDYLNRSIQLLQQQ